MVASVRRGMHRSAEGSLTLRRRPDVFISHSSRDKRIATEIARALTLFGIDAFLDVWELEAGDSLHRSLALALEKSRFVAVVISRGFSRSEWCLDELSQALAREKRNKGKVIIPLLLRNIDPLPFLADRVYIDFGRDFFSGIVRFAQIVHGLSKSRVVAELVANRPKSLRDAAGILQRAGWNNTSLFDEQTFALFKKSVAQHRIPHSLDRAGAISIDLEALRAHRHKFADLEVSEALIELYGTGCITLSEIRNLDPRLAETFRRVLFKAEYEGLSVKDISETLEVSAGTVARWKQGRVLPPNPMREALAVRLLTRLDYRQRRRRVRSMRAE
jgi:TIR domain